MSRMDAAKKRGADMLARRESAAANRDRIAALIIAARQALRDFSGGTL
jgi:hypothetical protein